MTAKTRSGLASDITTITDNTSGANTPAIMRGVLQDIVDSAEIDQDGYAGPGQILIGQSSPNPPVWVTPVGDMTLTSGGAFLNPIKQGALFGLGLSTAGSSSTFSVAAGFCVNSTGGYVMPLASAMAKTTGSWTVGSTNGALDTGSIANSTWYHAHLIERTDTGNVDVLVSLSATAPTLPTNYTIFRRIGAMKTNSSGQWTAFTQFGDEFLWSTPVTDASSVNPGTTATNYALSVPPGINVTARIRAALTNSATYNCFGLVYSPNESTQACNTPAGNFNLVVPVVSVYVAIELGIITDTSQHVTAVCSQTGSNALFLVTRGWNDPRGRTF